MATSVVVGGVTRPPVLGYDALGRLWTVTGSTGTAYLFTVPRPLWWWVA